MAEDQVPMSRLHAGPFPALEDRLLSSLPGLLGRSRREELLLLVPSNELREHLLRRLAAAWEGRAAGASILTLYDFALRLLKHRGLFPRELPPAQMAAALSAAVREVYAAGAGGFAAIAGTPGFVPALARSLADLDEGWIGDEALAAAERQARARGMQSRAARWGEWRRLSAAVDRKVGAMGGMTRRRIFQEAVAGFEQPGYPFRIILYGFYDFTRLQWILVSALLSSGLLEEVYFPALFREDGSLSPAFAFAAATWDRLSRAFEGNVSRLDGPSSPGVASVRERIFTPRLPAAAAPAPLTVLSAPHEEGEMRLAARQVRRWRDRSPGDEILVVARRFDETAVSDWERMAVEYGVRTVGRLAVPLSSAPPVRVLVQMIEAAVEGYPRRKVMDVLSSPYRRHAAGEGGAPPRPDLWDVWSREALVVSGDDWERRLARLRPRRGDREPGEEEGERAAQLALLRAEVRHLRTRLRPVVEARGYGEMAKGIRGLLLSEFRFVDDGSPEGERDRRALSALLALLDDVERIPERAVPWPGAGEALGWFSTLLSGQRLFVGEKGGMRVPGAVVAGDLNTLRGITADRVLFLSVNEDAVPAQVDEDPLLPDEERETLNRLARQEGLPEALSLLRANAAQEKLLFSLPAASAREEIAFSVLRADAEGAAKRPSRYLLQLLSQYAGPGVFSEDWASASGARIAFLPRSPFAALSADGPRSHRENALLSWRAGEPPRPFSGLPASGQTGPPRDDPAGIPWGRIAATLREISDRESGASLFPGPWTGRAAPPAWSATELDELARCPYRYFLRFRVGLSPVEEPEDELSLTPAETGIILHDILRMVGADAAAGEGWGDAGAATEKAFARFARENPTGLPGLFRIQCLGIGRDVAAFAAWERARAGAPGAYRVEAVERPFSIGPAGAVPALVGRVDRIDRGPSAEAEIIDYKYRDGKRERSPVDLIAHGLSNQVPVYLAFARTLSPPPAAARATLLFLKHGVRPVTVEDAQWKAVRDAWIEALSDWLALAGAGYFPPLPHHRFTFAGAAPPRYCDACAFKDHCRVSPSFEGSGREIEALLLRIGADPALAAVAGRRPAARNAAGRG